MLKIYISLLFIFILFKLNESVELVNCWKQTYGRGAGKSVSVCPPNEDKNGLLCYPKCQSGFTGFGPVCWEQCPSGYVDTGALCSPKGLDFFRKLTFPKKTYGRGVGSPMQCETNFTLDAGLCYEKCADNYKGIGPVCWADCQGDYSVDCGVFCSVSKSKCSNVMIEMGLTVANLLIQIAKLNPTQALNSLKDAQKSLGFEICK